MRALLSRISPHATELAMILAGLLILVAAIASSGCVTAGDLQRLADAQQRTEERVREASTDYRDGKIDQTRYLAELKDASTTQRAAMDSAIQDVKARTEAVLTTATTAGNAAAGGLPSLLLTGLASVLTSFGATNVYRNARNGSAGRGSDPPAA